MVLVYALCGLISVLAEQSVMEMVVIHLHTKTKLTAYILHTYTFTLIIFHFWNFTLMSHKIESIHIYFTISLASSHWSSSPHHWPLVTMTQCNSAAPVPPAHWLRWPRIWPQVSSSLWPATGLRTTATGTPAASRQHRTGLRISYHVLYTVLPIYCIVFITTLYKI